MLQLMANAQKMTILLPEWAGLDPVLDGGYPGLGHEVWRQCYKTFFLRHRCCSKILNNKVFVLGRFLGG
jgi:hypothetical protein